MSREMLLVPLCVAVGIALLFALRILVSDRTSAPMPAPAPVPVLSPERAQDVIVVEPPAPTGSLAEPRDISDGAISELPPPDLLPRERLFELPAQVRRDEIDMRDSRLDSESADASPGTPADRKAGLDARVSHHADEIGPPGARTPKRGTTDASIGVPVGESVSIRPGVRVEYEDDPTAGVTKVEPTPKVGVEVRF